MCILSNIIIILVLFLRCYMWIVLHSRKLQAKVRHERFTCVDAFDILCGIHARLQIIFSCLFELLCYYYYDLLITVAAIPSIFHRRTKKWSKSLYTKDDFHSWRRITEVVNHCIEWEKARTCVPIGWTSRTCVHVQLVYSSLMYHLLFFILYHLSAYCSLFISSLTCFMICCFNSLFKLIWICKIL